MMTMEFKKLIVFLFSFLCGLGLVSAEIDGDAGTNRILTIEEFIQEAVENDAVFEEILIDELSLKYAKDLILPAGDLILSVKDQYEFDLNADLSFDPDNDPNAAVSLNKLFPYTGTEFSAEYKTTPLTGADGNSSALFVLISQSLARNAFGRATALQDKIVGKEIDIATYQIIEAYEDYLALIVAAYYNWYSAYKNLEIGDASYQQNLKLLQNIKQRQRNNIALPIDVNKINIQALAKKEGLINLRESYEHILNLIKQAIRHKGDELLEPVDPFMYDNRDIVFESDYENFTKTSRTYRVLRLLEEKNSLAVKKNADDLLPSTSLLLGYAAEGEDNDLRNKEETVFSGISIIWPFPGQKERAEYNIAKIENRKTMISNENKYIQMHTDLKNLFNRIKREKELIAIAEEKIAMAESILEDEAKNYSYGKVSLNDFIDAVNLVDNNKFNRILHSVQLKIFMTEWLRLTDQLIKRKDIREITQ